MAWAQLVQAGMQAGSGLFDSGSAAIDARTSKSQGYLTADANETRLRARSAQDLGEQRATAVQSGFNANTGSLATVQSQSAGNLELDALTQRYKGQINAWQQDAILQRMNDKAQFMIDPLRKTKFGGSKASMILAGPATFYGAGAVDNAFGKYASGG